MLKTTLIASLMVAGSAISAAALTATATEADCDAILGPGPTSLTTGPVTCSALPARTDVGAVNLGAGDGDFFSLGKNGVAVFEIAPPFVRDGFVVEVTNANTDQFEAAEVLISEDGTTFTSVATATNFSGGSTTSQSTSFFVSGGPFSFIAFRDISLAFFDGSAPDRPLTTTVDGFDLDSFSVTPVPLPPAVAMLLAGVAGMGLIGRRRKAAA